MPGQQEVKILPNEVWMQKATGYLVYIGTPLHDLESKRIYYIYISGPMFEEGYSTEYERFVVEFKRRIHTYKQVYVKKEDFAMYDELTEDYYQAYSGYTL